MCCIKYIAQKNCNFWIYCNLRLFSIDFKILLRPICECPGSPLGSSSRFQGQQPHVPCRLTGGLFGLPKEVLGLFWSLGKFSKNF